MSTILTREQLKQMVKNPYIDHWYDALEQLLDDYEINTPQRVAAFVAQTAHESGNYVFLKENLNYKAESLMRVWPKYFPNIEIARQYANKQEMIANRAYANRMGNGDEHSNDGWTYRGRGIIQITGKNNYIKVSQNMFEDDSLVQNPDMLLDPEYAIHSAGWFWTAARLNELSDVGDLKLMTKRINGGYIGLEDRIKHYEHAVHILT